MTTVTKNVMRLLKKDWGKDGRKIKFNIYILMKVKIIYNFMGYIKMYFTCGILIITFFSYVTLIYLMCKAGFLDEGNS